MIDFHLLRPEPYRRREMTIKVRHGSVLKVGWLSGLLFLLIDILSFELSRKVNLEHKCHH